MWAPTDQLALDASTLERVLQTCVEMVTDRGYVVERASVGMDPVLIAHHPDEAGALHVRFQLDEKVGVKLVRQMLGELAGRDVHRLLLVSADGPTPFTRKEVAEDGRIEFWTFARLLFNVTRFHIVPPHRLVGVDEAAALAKRYHVSGADEWPKMKRTDPVCRYYDFPVGRLVRIDRFFAGAVNTYYRLVV